MSEGTFSQVDSQASANGVCATVNTAKLVSASEGYGLWAESYDDGRSPLLALEQRCLEPLLPAIHGQEILDVGCGTGRWLEWLLQQGATNVFGADFSAEMLRFAACKPRLAKRIVRASGMALPFQNARFDLILSSFMIGHIQDVSVVAGEIARVTRDGAQFFLSDFHPNAFSRGWRRSFRAHGQVFEVATTVHRLDDICERFENRGFRLCRRIEARFGEPERGIFEKTGKANLFEEASREPALYLLHFERVAARSLRSALKTAVSPDREVSGTASRNSVTCLVGARVTLDARTAVPATVAVEQGRVALLEPDAVPSRGKIDKNVTCVDLSGYILLPGLINAHDHLEFNLFPRIGGKIYKNYVEWSEDIYQPNRSPVREHRAVPKDVRLWWGGVKNLLSGVTTVSHHNPFHADVFNDKFPVRVVSRYGWAHSVAMGGDICAAYAVTPPSSPFIIHAGEGTDARCRQEIRVLDSLGVLRENTVLVHGVALDEAGYTLLRQRSAALVWCPSSNLFMLGTTLPGEVVAGNAQIVLGSDSALTAEGDLLDEMRIARSASGISPECLFEKVTAASAEVLCLDSGEGSIREGGVANLIAIRDQGKSPAGSLAGADFRDIELVITGGAPVLMSAPMRTRWKESENAEREEDALQTVWVEGALRFLAAPVSRLFEETTRWLGHDFQLAGKRVVL